MSPPAVSLSFGSMVAAALAGLAVGYVSYRRKWGPAPSLIVGFCAGVVVGALFKAVCP